MPRKCRHHRHLPTTGRDTHTYTHKKQLHNKKSSYCRANQESDSDVMFCLKLLNKTLTCTLHLR